MALTQVSRGLLSTSIVDNGNATAITIDSSENVGIGTASPDAVLTTENSGALTTDSNDGNHTGFGLLIEPSTITANTVNSAIGFASSSGRKYAAIGMQTYADVDQNGLNFYVQSTASGSSAQLSEAMRIDSSGNVGIGVSSLVTGSSRRILQVSTGSDGGQIAFADSTTEAANPRIFATNKSDLKLASANSGSSTIQFITGTTTPAEAMRIDSSGNLLVGDSSVASASNSACTINSGGRIDTSRAATNLQTHHQFFNPNGVVGTITTTGSATAFNTSSDQRLKENIVDAPSASDDIDAIQVRSFDWKADGSHQKYGMVAQELQSVAPEAVSGDADSDDMMGVDYSKLVPMMLKEIQSLRSRVQQLEN